MSGGAAGDHGSGNAREVTVYPPSGCGDNTEGTRHGIVVSQFRLRLAEHFVEHIFGDVDRQLRVAGDGHGDCIVLPWMVLLAALMVKPLVPVPALAPFSSMSSTALSPVASVFARAPG